jgi:hypothetical protein
MPWLRFSFIGRHWRGELSLPVSYFVTGFLVAMTANGLVYLLTNALADSYDPVLSVAAILSFWSCALLIGVWQLVGIWRSAQRHLARGGKPLWAHLAKLMVVIGAAMTAFTLANHAWPQIREGLSILAGDPTVGAFAIRSLGNGAEIELSGGISFRAAEALEAALEAAPQVRLVRLDSRGGRLGPAKRIRDLISTRGLSTYVRRQCLSACVVAYAGGRQRYLHPGARLGLHRSSFPGVPDREMRADNLAIVEEMVAAGVDRAFAEKALLRNADTMWFPTLGELVESGLVTQLRDGP